MSRGIAAGQLLSLAMQEFPFWRRSISAPERGLPRSLCVRFSLHRSLRTTGCLRPEVSSGSAATIGVLPSDEDRAVIP